VTTRVLCLTYEYPPVGGGGGFVAESLARSLGTFGYEIDVVTSHLRGMPELETDGHLTVHRVPCLRFHRHYSNTLELAALLWPLYRKALTLISSKQYDFNHTHFALPTGVIAHRLWKRTGLSYALTLHGSDVPGYNPDRFSVAHAIMRPYWRKIVMEAKLVVSPSNFLAGLTAQHVRVPISTVPNGYDPVAGTYPAKRNCILVVTRMFERKGVQHFLEAIRDWDTDWEIFIAGDGPYLAKLSEIAKTVRPRVRFLGFLSRDRLAELYGAARIFVFPSIQENFPVVLLEAMHAGCAIVTTDADGCAEVIGDAGIKTPPADPAAIREALLRLMHDPVATESYAEKARRRAEGFAWPRIARRYDDLFAKTFASNAGAGAAGSTPASQPLQAQRGTGPAA